jgi:hypothetical protein
LNFGDRAREVELAGPRRIALSTVEAAPNFELRETSLTLQSYEGVLATPPPEPR